MISFDELMTKWNWKPIRGCPGRYILNSAPIDLSPQDLLGDVELNTFQVPGARDRVVVARFEKGGLISYRRTGDVYLHTLNTTEGFERKLTALGIELNE